MDLSNNVSNENESVETLIRKLNEKGTKVKIVKDGESPTKKGKKTKKSDKENAGGTTGTVDAEVLKKQEIMVQEKQQQNELL